MTGEYIIIHTAAHGGPNWNGDTTAEDINRWHLENGWSGIGYNFVVRLDGMIEPGRLLHKKGAHCKEPVPGRPGVTYNDVAYGICFAGHGDYFELTPEQYESGAWLCRTVIRHERHNFKGILGHRETGAAKTCPGNKVNMDDFRRMVYAGSTSAVEDCGSSGTG